MSRHLTRLLKSIRVLGFFNGGAVYFYYFYHRLVKSQAWAPRQMRVRNISKPIWMRPGVSDWIVMERIFLDREYDPLSVDHDAAMDDLSRSIIAQGKRPLIIDCGANIGMSSVWFAERFPDATIIAVEPQPENFKILALNARNFPNIIPVKAAISDKMSRVSLSNETGTPWAWKTQESETGEVATLTIPHLANLVENAELMAVKVDIEGFEVNLFRDSTDWVDGLPLMMFEMHDWMTPWSGSGHAFLSVLVKHRRDYLVRGENIFSYALPAQRRAAPATAAPEVSIAYN
jgi:FkbM family methyltransferase